MIKVWKVTRIYDQRYFSTDAVLEMQVEYELEKWAVPPLPSSPLFTFSSLEIATDWVSVSSVNFAILECEAELFDDWEESRSKIPCLCDWSTQKLTRYWLDRPWSRYLSWAWPLPAGTVLCSKVKPLRVAG